MEQQNLCNLDNMTGKHEQISVAFETIMKDLIPCN